VAKLLAGRFNRFVEKLFSTKEGRSSLDTISPELQMTYTMLTGVEDRYLQGWNRYLQQFQEAAQGVGNISAGMIRNPAGSNLVAVLESLWYSNSVNDTPSMVLIPNRTTDLQTVASTVNRLDARGNQSPGLRMSIGFVGVTPIGATLQLAILANTSIQFIQTVDAEIAILPGDALLIESGTANVALNGTMIWRERVLEPSELS
jgi:hypothetical protein